MGLFSLHSSNLLATAHQPQALPDYNLINSVKMPRDGSGASDNVVEAGSNLVHGAAAGGSDAPAASGVDRSNKAAAPPAPEKGDALEGMLASGGGSAGPTQSGGGDGPIESASDKIAKEQGK